ncbi:MAG: YibE/F family protein [Fibrobacterota bacterium]
MKNKKKADRIFVVFVAVLSIVLFLIPTGFENPFLRSLTERAPARVIAVNNEDLQKHGIILTGTQVLDVKILSGVFRGDTLKARNVLIGQMSIDNIFIEGDKVLTVLKTDKETGKISSARADSLYRINVEVILLVLFGLFLVYFAGWTGLRALISFIFTALVIWKVLIPLFLKGFPPLPLSFFIVSFISIVIIILITGFERKGAVALAGTISGIGITALLAVIFGHFFRVPGTVKEFSEMLLYAGFIDLNLTDIFIAGIFISATGAVMDVAMDIAASQQEVVFKHPDITSRELISSGFRVAKPVIGTMTTTLLFAYSGSFTFVMMMFMSKGTPMVHIFNVKYIAAEILKTLVGSFGLVLVAPATAILGGYIYTYKNKIN